MGMNKSNRFLAVSSAAILLTVGAGTAQAETLQEAVQVLLETNPELRAVSANRNIRDEIVRQARADYFPRVDFEAGAGIQEFQEPDGAELDPRVYRLGLRQNLFTGSGAFLDVLLKEQINGLADENLVIHKRILDQIKLRSGSGVSRKADLDQIESRLSLAQANVVNTRANLIDSKTAYQSVVGHIPKDLVQPQAPDDLMPASLEEAERLAVDQHPRLKSTNYDLEAREAQHDIAKAPYYPVFDLELDKIWNEELFLNNVLGPAPDRESWIAMLRLRWNLFNGMRDNARKKETAYQINEAQEIRNNAYRQVIESVRLSWASYQAAIDRLDFLQSRVDSARRTTEAYSKQWNIGQRTLLDVLDSEAELINAREELYEAQTEKQVAQYRILDGLGRLVPALGLMYPQQAYLEDEEEENSTEQAAAVEVKQETAPASAPAPTKLGPG
jgi:adhesin transport system outer membrane protein